MFTAELVPGPAQQLHSAVQLEGWLSLQFSRVASSQWDFSSAAMDAAGDSCVSAQDDATAWPPKASSSMSKNRRKIPVCMAVFKKQASPQCMGWPLPVQLSRLRDGGLRAAQG